MCIKIRLCYLCLIQFGVVWLKSQSWLIENYYFYDLEFRRAFNKIVRFVTVPGTGGNKMQAKLNKPSAPWFCYSTTSYYFDLWLDPIQLLYGSCWADNMKLTYNNISRRTQNQLGVDIQIPGWPVRFRKQITSLKMVVLKNRK